MRQWTCWISLSFLLCLLQVSCGGGGGGGSSVTVTVSPKTASVLLDGTQQFLATVTNGNVQVATIASSGGAVRTANVVTITTTSAHGLITGQSVVIAGVTDSSFNGTFTVSTVPSTTVFTYSQTGPDGSSGSGTVSTGAVTWCVAAMCASGSTPGGNSTLGTINQTGFYTAPAALPPAVTVSITSNGAVRSNNVVTITTTAAHNLLVGQAITITGVSDGSFNGTFAVASVPSTTTFTYSQTGSNASSGSGTVTTNAVQITVKSVKDNTKSDTAVVSVISNVRVAVSPKTATIGVGENFQFTATVTGTTKTAVTWSVVTTGTVGSINPTKGLYTAPGTVPSPAQVTIKATATVDPSQSDTATVTIVAAAAPTLTAISPTSAAQGSFLQDIYLTGTNFLSTSTARVNGTPVPTTFISSTLLRARVPGSLLGVAGVSTVDVQPQMGAPSATANLTVEAVRPALIGTSPDSVRQTLSGAAQNVSFDGGYFSPSVTAEFNDQVRAATLTSSRQLSVTLSSSDLATAGLFSVDVQNSAATQPLASVNLAVQPSGASSPTVVSTLPVGTQPSAVAVNTATGVAVVVNQGSNDITLIALSAPAPSLCPGLTTFPGVCKASISVGSKPTEVAVDPIRSLAVVANNGSKTISLVDLASGTVKATINSPTPSGASQLQPVSVGVNPLTGLALVANQSTNMATILDLKPNPPAVAGTVGISTGTNPRVAIEPRLNWAIVTPGGAGTVSIVDLGRQSVVATLSVGLGVRGISINTETEQALLTDPTSTSATLFSVLDQTVAQVPLTGTGNVAGAVNPLTNIGITVSEVTAQASVIDLRTATVLGTVPLPGAKPSAVAIDPGSNFALVTDKVNNQVSFVSLGAIRSPHVTAISPASTFTSTPASDLQVTIIGFGFAPDATACLDRTVSGCASPLPPTFVSPRLLTATIPAAMLAGPRRYRLDVINTGSCVMNPNNSCPSNGSDFAVIQAVPVGTAPQAVAIDPQRNLAVVTNSGSNNISVVDLTTGKVTRTIAVGTNPQGVAVIPRLGRAVVTNHDSNNASLVDLVGGTVTSTVTLGTAPVGVAVNQDTLTAVVADSGSNTIHFFAADTGQNVTMLAVDQQPVAVAIDPTRNQAAVAQAAQNNVAIVSLAGTPSILARVTSGLQLPTAVTYDPASDRFLALSSLGNNLFIITPDTFQATQARVGINPTSLASNFNSSTIVTLNTASNTLSVMDALQLRIRVVLPLSGSQRSSVDIHPQTNLAVVADGPNNRVLLVPLPH